MGFALLGAAGPGPAPPLIAASEPKPTRTPAPTTFELLLDLKNRVLDEKARDKNLVIGIQVTDTKEGFTVELADGKVDVREGLPPRAGAVLSGRRSTVEKILAGTETLSGAIRRNLVDVQGSIDKLFELIDCCVQRRN